MHVNSLAAYQAGDERMFSVRELSVLGAVGRLRVASDREVMVALGFSDMNAVRPRITELVDDGVLEEVCSKEDPVTRKTVRVVGIRNREDKQAELPLFGG
jgi:hypothetical protein